ncbi:hypothetical protein [Bifidobacterium miconisargentati]|uniref:hypothetical protein n=1 Tax=Bifidobacterium miconisargentati TaxID=2834437 RepID=UPI001BDD7607|nr:hypothetical protein [Bifidobacterium miconisargentati]MBW3090929.1 hypothetical protein [Bifidobacterium miconisargentati]
MTHEWGISSAMGFFVHPGQCGWFMMFVGMMYLAEYMQIQRRKTLLYAIAMMVCAVLSMKVKVVITLLRRVVILGEGMASITFYIGDFSHTSGTEYVTTQIAAYLVQQGYVVTVLSHNEEGITSFSCDEDIQVMSLRMERHIMVLSVEKLCCM